MLFYLLSVLLHLGLHITFDGMVSCGITKRKIIILHRPFLRATNLQKPLKPACTMPCVNILTYFFCPAFIELFLVRLYANSFILKPLLPTLSMCIQAIPLSSLSPQYVSSKLTLEVLQPSTNNAVKYSFFHKSELEITCVVS